MGDSFTIDQMRGFHASGQTLSRGYRRLQLRALRDAIAHNEERILQALQSDLGKSPLDAYTTEVGYVLSDIDHALRHLAQWMKPQRRKTPLIAWPGRSRIEPLPYGVALIVGPWNYPFQLLFSPFVAALAAGNCVCLKPSELAPATSAIIGELIDACFAPDYVSVVTGGVDTATRLLEEPFDFIFFTGSTAVGRKVMAAAARNLTPVTLELGGKSPCIVCADAKIELAARRILWGKCLNAGQTCVAPDYVLIDARVRDAFVAALRNAHEQFYGGTPQQSDAYGRIVNRAHFDRLVAYLDSGGLAMGGEHDADTLYIAPTVLLDPPDESPVMREEIFGPILPVVTYEDLDAAVAGLRSKPTPLALYLFTGSRRTQHIVLRNTISGGVCINDTMNHIVGKELPFGGMGPSGMGAYHGRAGFECFTHQRSVLQRGTAVDPTFRYPPPRAALRHVKKAYTILMGR